MGPHPHPHPPLLRLLRPRPFLPNLTFDVHQRRQRGMILRWWTTGTGTYFLVERGWAREVSRGLQSSRRFVFVGRGFEEVSNRRRARFSGLRRAGWVEPVWQHVRFVCLWNVRGRKCVRCLGHKACVRRWQRCCRLERAIRVTAVTHFSSTRYGYSSGSQASNRNCQCPQRIQERKVVRLMAPTRALTA